MEIAPENLTNCTFGDVNAAVTIGVYGDSNAAMWAPTLDIFGHQHHFRVIILTHIGCTTWPRPWAPRSTSVAGVISEFGCVAWRQNVLTAFQHSKVTYAVPISIDTSNKKDFVQVTKLTNSLTVNFEQIRKFGMRPLVLTPVTQFDSQVAYLNCLSRNSKNLRLCMIATSDVAQQRINQAVESSSAAKSVTQVATTDLFCAAQRCPLFLKWEGRTIQIYRDGRHMTLVYAQLIAGAIAPRLSSALVRAH